MDAYSICYASASNREASRIYQDLWSTRPYSLTQLKQERIRTKPMEMDDSRKNQPNGTNLKPHVGIIGAGLSGLRCADVLIQHGLKVTILEGRDRVGGRLHQEKLSNGHLVDLGPNWIHGTKDNPILDLAQQTGTDVGSWDDRSNVFDESGTRFPLEEGEKYAGIMWDIVQGAFKHSNKSGESIDVTESLHDFFVQEVAKRIPESEADWERKRKIVMQVSEMWGAFVGSPISRQSLKFFWLEECIEGENLFCAGTYKKIIDTIARPVLSHADIKYNTIVDKISYRTRPEEQVRVQIRDGTEMKFDELVTTSPLGWLKRNLGAFQPELPARLTKAVDSIGYGCLEKVYVSFSKAFWLSTIDDQEDEVKGFAQWISPTYASEMNPKKWHQEAVELASLESDNAHPTLLFYIYGEQSEYLTSRVAECSSEKEKQSFLLDYFKPYYSRLPHYSENSSDCAPTGCFATSWMRDQLAGNGSYSNFQVGLEEGDEDIKTMRQGLPEQGLWLAGEHTAPFVALGTATGAYWSGEAVARRILDTHGLA